jgi:hypothetical protein
MRRLVLLVPALLLLSFNAAASTMPRPVYPLCANEQLRSCIMDGNTFWYGGELMRLENVNPPEPAREACAPNASTAAAATARLFELLNFKEIFVFRYGTDADGHTLTRVISGGHDVGQVLIDEHLAQPNTSSSGAWCQ